MTLPLTYRGIPVMSLMFAQDELVHGEKLTMYLKMNPDVFRKSALYKTYRPLFDCEDPPLIHTSDEERLYIVISNKSYEDIKFDKDIANTCVYFEVPGRK